MKTTKTLGLFAAAATLGLLSTMCSDSGGTSTTTTGGTPSTTGGVTNTGGTTGGNPTGGNPTGGTSTGGITGGTSTGGTATGGNATGGTAGSSTGGSAGGGASGGGAGGASGSSSTGGKADGGASGSNTGGAGGISGGGGGAGGGGGKGGGGNATGGSGGSATGTFADVAKILDSNCSKCHDGSKADRVNLKNDAGLYMRLTTAIPTSVAKCGGTTLVDKASPAMSILPQVIQMAVNVTGCSVGRMPNQCSGKSCLSAGDIQTITSWVNAGAPQN